MENQENILDNICRLCLSRNSSKTMVSLIDKSKKHGLSCYGKSVMVFANIHLTSNKHLPNKLCSKCLFMLKQAIRFKLMCESSENKLKKLFEQPSNAVSDQDVKCAKSKKKMSISVLPEPSKSASNNLKGDTLQETDCLVSSLPVYDDILFDNIITTSGKKSRKKSKPEKNCEDALFNKIEKIFCKNSYLDKIQHKNTDEENCKLKSNYEKIDNFKCKICQRVLSNRGNYLHHMERHNGCRYICEHCGKGFPVRRDLESHLVVRHGTGPYISCSQCNFKAPRKFDLKEHMRIHTGERPYTCDKCGLSFRRKAVWRKHQVYHEERTVPCKHCPRLFFHRSEMLAHVNSTHERMYMYACHICNVTYAKNSTVRRHMAEKHDVPREKQGKIRRINKNCATGLTL